MSPIYLSQISFTPGRHRHPQRQLNQWMNVQYSVAAGESSAESWNRNERLYTGGQHIESRWLEAPLASSESEFGLVNADGHEPTLGQRMNFYSQVVTHKLLEHLGSLPNADLPQSLVHVSCTGYQSPSPPQKALSQLRIKNCDVMHVYHMGCSAAVPGLRVAAGQTLLSGGSTLVFHSELCGLHFSRRAWKSAEQKVVQSLFGDAYGSYRVSKECPLKEAFRLLKTQEEIIPGTQDSMLWKMEEPAFRMHLGREVPDLIGQVVSDFVYRLTDGQSRADLRFAIHPGGPKILDTVQSTLELSPDQMASSRRVLNQYGNLSSATLVALWQQELLQSRPGDQLVSLAFGPGLTIVGALFERC